MTIKKLMMGAGAIDEPQVIALSSNDFDYTFSNNEHPVAGNTLGDHTIGAYWKAIGSNNGISSLITLDGDFEIEFTLAETNQSEFGVHAIDEDDTRTTDSRVGMSSMTNSFWYRDESVTDFMIGGSTQSDTHTFADGSVVKIERVSGTIKVYDDDVVVHTYGTTYTGAMRFGAGDPGPQEADYDNFKITDTDKVQRDGFFNEGAASAMSASSAFNGARIVATRSGVVTSVKFNVASVSSSYNGHCEIWVGDGTNPTAQLGSDSDTVAMSSTGDKTFTFSAGDAIIKKGQFIWAIIAQETSGSINLSCVATFGQSRSGLGSAATSLSDEDRDYKMEMVVDTSDGEPTPDNNTYLLLSPNASDTSTSIVDLGPLGLTATLQGNVQHDTAQNKFGASAYLFDGTGDGIEFPDHARWKVTGDFTCDLWVRFATIGQRAQLIDHRSNNSASGLNFYMQLDTADKIQVGIGNDGGAAKEIKASTAVSADTWYHVCMMKTADTLYYFQNGVLEISSSGTMAGTDVSAPIRIGGNSADASALDLDGWIAGVRISNTARFAVGGFTPPTAYYP